MIGIFPELLPDELLYSAFARYAAMMDYSSPSSVLEDLFGSRTATAVIDLPGHLDRFLSRLPPRHPYTADRLISAHTMLPLYAPFLPVAKVVDARRIMCSESGRGLHRLLNASGRWVKTPRFLQFCRRCVDMSLAANGTAPWLRTHQAPGVRVCPIHGQVLHESVIERAGRADRLSFFPLNDTVVATAVPMSRGGRHARYWIGIAQDAHLILNKSDQVIDLHQIHDLYSRWLVDLGWIDGNTGLRRAAALERAFVAYYPAKFLDEQGCPAPDAGSGDTWISGLLQVTSRPKSPVHHLLLMRFLAGSAEAFLAGPPEQRSGVSHSSVPADRPTTSMMMPCPGPCRNPGCDRADLEGGRAISPGSGASRRVSVRCTACGFSYVYDSNCPRLWRVESVGGKWTADLIRLVNETALTQKEIAARLGVSTSHMRKIAWSLGVTRESWRNPRDSRKHAYVRDPEGRRFAELRDRKHLEFLYLRDQFPDDSRSALAARAPLLIAWLRRNDPEWLEQALPPRTRRASVVETDWNERDREMLAEVKRAVEALLAQPERPRAISIARIGKQMRRRQRLEQHLTRLPETARYLAEVVETPDQCALRRLEWAVGEFIREGRVPGPWTLSRRAGFAAVPDAERIADLTVLIDRVQDNVGEWSAEGPAAEWITDKDGRDSR